MPIAGMCFFHGASTPPTGALECDGSILAPRGQYAELYAAIGTTWNTFDGQSDPQSTNSMWWSNDQTPSSGAYGSQYSTITKDQVGIMGAANTACLFKDDNGGGTNVMAVWQTVAVTSGQNNVYKAWLKADQLSDALVLITGFDGIEQFFVDLSTATKGTQTGGTVCEVVDEGNGWVCCYLQFSATTTLTGNVALYIADGENVTLDRDGTSSIIIGNMELHLNAVIADVKDIDPIYTIASTTTHTSHFRVPLNVDSGGLPLYPMGKGSAGSVGDKVTGQNKTHDHTGSTSDSQGNHYHSCTESRECSALGNWGNPTPQTVWEAGTYTNNSTLASTGNHTHTVTIDNQGSDDFRPESIVGLWCIWALV